MKKLILIGAGAMALEYAKVLNNLGYEYDVIGRGEVSANNFKKIVGKEVYLGGLENNKNLFNSYTIVINAVNIESLYSTTLFLINMNVKKILIEKPGSLCKEELNHLFKLSQANNIEVFIAYNRRFYNSIRKAIEIIKVDGGLKACNFEFTEYSNKIQFSKYHSSVKAKWLLANSSHVIDTVLYICGFPEKINTFIRKGDINWHNSGAGFCGSGISKKGVFFTYMSNWDCPGRWGIELITSERRILLSPMEKIKQKFSNEEYKDIIIKNSDDINFKPGITKLLKNFLIKDEKIMCKLEEQIINIDIYNKMAAYH